MNISTFTNFGRFVDQVMEPLFEYLQDDSYAIAPALAGVIVILACVALVAYAVHVCYYTRKLRAQRIALKNVLGPKATVENIGNVKQVLSGFLTHTWTKFEETLVKPVSKDEPNPSVLNTVRPQVFFNSTDVGLNFRFYRALPGLFVGVGLLLTFIGLVAALDSAVQTINDASGGSSTTPDDLLDANNRPRNVDSGPAELQNTTITDTFSDERLSQNNDTLGALNKLLQSAKFKFYTSVAGLGASIVLSIAIRIGDKFIDRGFSLLSATLEDLFHLQTLENLVTKQLKEDEDQSAELKKINTEIAVAIGVEVKKALDTALPTHLGALGGKLDNFAENLSGINSTALKNMTDTFAEKIGDSTQELIGSMKQTLEDVGNTLERVQQSIEPTIEKSAGELRDAVNSMNSAISTASANHKSNLDEIQKTLKEQGDRHKSDLNDMSEFTKKQIEDIVNSTRETSNLLTHDIKDSVNQVSASLRAAAKEFEKHLVTIKASIDSQASISQSFREVERSVSTAAISLKEVTDPLSQVAREINETRIKIEEAISSGASTMTEAANNLKDAASQARSAWEGYSSRFANVDDSLQRLCNDLLGHLQRGENRFTDYMRKMDSDLAVCVNQLHSVLEEIRELLDEHELPKKRDESQA